MTITMASFSTTGAAPSGQTSGAGAPNAAPTTSVLDLFAQLKEFSWKGVSFPVTEFDKEIRHDLVIHRSANRNGAYVEDTGRHPVQITATIPFLNYVYSGKQETWPQGALYPYQWRLFIAKCLETTSGTLVHPELGELTCKLDRERTAWSGKVQGGVWVSATWVESDDTQADQLGQDLSSASPISNVIATADDFDENIATLAAAVEAQKNPLPPLPFTFDELANAVIGAIDSTTVLQKEWQGRVDNMIYQANRVQDSIERSPIGPLLWPLFQDAQRMKDAAYQLKALPALGNNRSILTGKISKDMTLAEAALTFGAQIADVVVLNTALVGSPVLPRGTTIRYYAKAA